MSRENIEQIMRQSYAPQLPYRQSGNCGSVLELAGAEYMVRASGYLKTLDDFRAVPLVARGGVPVRLGDVATLQIGPEMRHGIAELDGEGEVAGGVVILRSGKNAQETIAAVKAKLGELQASLPQGVEIVTTYDRIALIERAIRNLTIKLGEEFLVVALVCVLFLWHLRSALVAIISLPLGVMMAFLIMRYQGINANIMSLGGIDIAMSAAVGRHLRRCQFQSQPLRHGTGQPPVMPHESQPPWDGTWPRAGAI